MKLLFLTVLSLSLYSSVYCQANTTLSNLVSPTAVNQTVQPKATNSYNLGSSSLSWKDLYLRGHVYLDGTRFLSNAPAPVPSMPLVARMRAIPSKQVSTIRPSAITPF